MRPGGPFQHPGFRPPMMRGGPGMRGGNMPLLRGGPPPHMGPPFNRPGFDSGFGMPRFGGPMGNPMMNRGPMGSPMRPHMPPRPMFNGNRGPPIMPNMVNFFIVIHFLFFIIIVYYKL